MSGTLSSTELILCLVVVEKFVSLTCKPLVSSSKPKARTTVRAGLKCFSSKVSMDALFWGLAWHRDGDGQEGRDTYSIPITPLLSSELPLPQMNLPINNSSKKSKTQGHTTNPVQYRHSAQSKVGVAIHRQSRAQREPHLRVRLWKWPQSMSAIDVTRGQTLMAS